jgi:hypothetical protein
MVEVYFGCRELTSIGIPRLGLNRCALRRTPLFYACTDLHGRVMDHQRVPDYEDRPIGSLGIHGGMT